MATLKLKMVVNMCQGVRECVRVSWLLRAMVLPHLVPPVSAAATPFRRPMAPNAAASLLENLMDCSRAVSIPASVKPWRQRVAVGSCARLS